MIPEEMHPIIDLFTARATAANAEVTRCATLEEALRFIGDLLRQEGVADTPGRRALWAFPPADRLDRGFLDESPGLSCQVTQQRAAEARVGISRFGWGVADTGTLVQDAAAVEHRLVSTLPEIHVALLPTRGILPDLPALLTRLTPAESSYISFITGPSRTADIERVLTIGVHGPGRLLILLVDDLEVA